MYVDLAQLEIIQLNIDNSKKALEKQIVEINDCIARLSDYTDFDYMIQELKKFVKRLENQIFYLALLRKSLQLIVKSYRDCEAGVMDIFDGNKNLSSNQNNDGNITIDSDLLRRISIQLL